MTQLIMLNMLFASTFTLAKAALAYVQPIFFIGMRMAIAGILLLGFQYFFRSYAKIDTKQLRWFLAVMVFHIYIPFVFEFWALQYISSAKTALLYSCTPFITALLAYYFYDEKFTQKKWIGLLIGFVGFLPILLTHDVAESNMGRLFFLSTAEIVLLIGICSSVIGWLLVKKLVRENFSAIQVNGIGMFGGGVLALITSCITEKNPFTVQVPQQASALSAKLEHFLLTYFSAHEVDIFLFVLYMLLLIFIANIVCYNLYAFMLRRFSATLLALSGLMIPGFAAIFGVVFLGEHISWQFLVSVIVVCVGLVIFYREDIRLQKNPEKWMP